MSKQDNFSKICINLKGDPKYLINIREAFQNVSSEKINTNTKIEGASMKIDIKAKDFNILLAVSNSVIQFLNMINKVNDYE